MNKAIRAMTIGDKIYHLERIHSKIVQFARNPFALTAKDDREKAYLLLSMEKLKIAVSCFNNSNSSKRFTKYINAIENSIANLSSNKYEEFFQSACIMHGMYIKFSRKSKHHLVNTCELQYQDVCTPLWIIEESIKQHKKNKPRDKTNI
jgi:hypothetical protein